MCNYTQLAQVYALQSLSVPRLRAELKSPPASKCVGIVISVTLFTRTHAVFRVQYHMLGAMSLNSCLYP